MTDEPVSTNAPDIFESVYNQNWENARHVKNERITFMNSYSLITAGVLTLLENIHIGEVIRTALLLFMVLFSGIGLLTSLRLKGELEECLSKIEAISLQAKANQFVALGQLAGRSRRYPRFRWIFPIFYSMTTAGFLVLLLWRLIEAAK